MKAERLEMELCRTLERPLLPYEKVIQACGRMSDRMVRGDYQEWIERAGLTGLAGQGALLAAARQISREVLSERVKRELGEDGTKERERFPLGILLHLSAGNVAGSGAYSVIEGLLAGNINLLKPSSADGGISAFLLKELIRSDPELRPYIHLFSISSDRQAAIQRLAGMADGVVVWGSDETVKQIRAMVGPDKKLIEWGHKFSFVYCSEKGMEDRKERKELARHIIETRQRFCSSCQAVLLDTEQEEKALEFAGALQGEIHGLQGELKWDKGQVARETLREQTLMLEDLLCRRDRWAGGRVDRSMTDRAWAGGCPVRCLPKRRLIWELRKLPVSLQTAGLICREEEWEELSFLLLKAGAVRVKRPGQMGELFGSRAHDGEYPLLRYTKAVEHR